MENPLFPESVQPQPEASTHLKPLACQLSPHRGANLGEPSVWNVHGRGEGEEVTETSGDHWWASLVESESSVENHLRIEIQSHVCQKVLASGQFQQSMTWLCAWTS